jgi:hypothetical protein
MSENEDFAGEELDSDLVASDISEVDEDIDDEDEITDEEADFESDDDEDFEDDEDDSDDDDESDDESDDDGEFDDDSDDEEAESEFADSSAPVTGAQVLSGPVFALESLPVTGEARVDDALGRLGDLEGLPVSDHPGVFEDVQRRLHDTLADLAGS